MAEQSYPELEKVQANSEKSQAIGEFIDWLQDEKKIVLYKWDDEVSEHHPVPDRTPITQLLAEFFGVDMKKVEVERQQILKSLQK